MSSVLDIALKSYERILERRLANSANKTSKIESSIDPSSESIEAGSRSVGSDGPSNQVPARSLSPLKNAAARARRNLSTRPAPSPGILQPLSHDINEKHRSSTVDGEFRAAPTTAVEARAHEKNEKNEKNEKSLGPNNVHAIPADLFSFPSYTLVDKEPGIVKVIAALQVGGRVGLDTETTGLRTHPSITSEF